MPRRVTKVHDESRMNSVPGLNKNCKSEGVRPAASDDSFDLLLRNAIDALDDSIELLLNGDDAKAKKLRLLMKMTGMMIIIQLLRLILALPEIIHM